MEKISILKIYNAPGLKGVYYKSRRRITEIYAKEKVHSPSPTFNCVGPGAVGTGTLAGMRFLNSLKNEISIWPIDKIENLKRVLLLKFFQRIILECLELNQLKN